MPVRLVPAIIAVGYAFVLFYMLKNHMQRQLIMILNTIALTVLSLAIAIFGFFYTSWFSISVTTTFSKTMIIIGLLNFMLSFTFKIFKHS